MRRIMPTMDRWAGTLWRSGPSVLSWGLGMSQLPKAAGEREVRAFLKVVWAEVEKRAPGRFSFHFGPLYAKSVSGLIVYRQGIPGHGVITPVSHWKGTCQGGVIREGARVEYSAAFYTQGPWLAGERVSWHTARAS